MSTSFPLFFFFVMGYMPSLEIKVYMVYCYTIFGTLELTKNLKNDEVRWQVIKAMLDEFPRLKEKVKDYLKEQSLK